MPNPCSRKRQMGTGAGARRNFASECPLTLVRLASSRDPMACSGWPATAQPRVATHVNPDAHRPRITTKLQLDQQPLQQGPQRGGVRGAPQQPHALERHRRLRRHRPMIGRVRKRARTPRSHSVLPETYFEASKRSASNSAMKSWKSLLAAVGRGGHQHEVPCRGPQQLPELVALRVLHLAAEEARRHAVRLVAHTRSTPLRPGALIGCPDGGTTCRAQRQPRINQPRRHDGLPHGVGVNMPVAVRQRDQRHPPVVPALRAGGALARRQARAPAAVDRRRTAVLQRAPLRSKPYHAI